MMKKIDDIVKRLPKEDDLGWLFVFIIVLAFQNLWVPGMFSDGVLYAAIGKNSALSGNWLTPSFMETGHYHFFEHPPFFLMFEGLLFKLFGASWTVARLSGLFFTAGTVLSLWYFVKRISGKQVAYLAGVILLLCLPFLKKSRFPALDHPLTFFITLSIFNYYLGYLSNRWRDWILSGLFFGMALLMKGFPAMIVPVTVFFHLIIVRDFRKMISLKPWVAMVIGLAIFSCWPILLAASGNFYGFQKWFNKQFFATVVNARGKTDYNFFTYFIFLMKFCAPWVLLAVWGVVKRFGKLERGDIAYLAIAWFLAVLIPFSIPTWKYSHYILPVYPALALLAALGLSCAGERWCRGFINVSRGLVIVVALLLLAFPLGTKIRRDKHVFQTIETVKHLAHQPTAWAIVDDVYPFWSLAATVQFETGATVYRVKSDEIQEIIEAAPEKKWIFLCNSSSIKKIKDRNYDFFQQSLVSLLHFPNLIVVVEKEIMQK